MDKSTHKLIVIAGPTAVGKTELAIRMAERLGTEIISADSRQVYREMNIGTAKPSEEDLRRVPHHFVNVKSIHEDYDAGQFGREALDVIHALFKKHHRLVMVGGSGLYIKAVCEGFDDMPDVPPGVREAITEKYEMLGLGWLQRQLEERDPDYFATVDKKNPHRLIRALELIEATNQPVGSLRKQKKVVHPFAIEKIALELPRELLYTRIDERMDRMMAAGLFDEAAALFPLRQLNALQTVGYSEIFGFMEGKYDREEAVRLLKRNSRRYAKRQLTWFRKDEEFHWFDARHAEQILSSVV